MIQCNSYRFGKRRTVFIYSFCQEIVCRYPWMVHHVVPDIRTGPLSLLDIPVSIGNRARAYCKRRLKETNNSHPFHKSTVPFIPVCVSYDCYLAYGLPFQIYLWCYMTCALLMCSVTTKNKCMLLFEFLNNFGLSDNYVVVLKALCWGYVGFSVFLVFFRLW